MGFLDSLTKSVGELLGGPEEQKDKQKKLAEAATDIVADKESGGLEGLARLFKNKGLGDVISSWIGTGQNQPVTAEQVENVIGSERIRQYAEKLGFSNEDVSNGIAAVLPRIIDVLTPDGQVPDQPDLDQEVAGLKDRLSSAEQSGKTPRSR